MYLCVLERWNQEKIGTFFVISIVQWYLQWRESRSYRDNGLHWAKVALEKKLKVLYFELYVYQFV